MDLSKETYFADRFKDNYYKGLMMQIAEAIDGCDDYETLSKIAGSLKGILGGRARNKANDILNSNIDLLK